MADWHVQSIFHFTVNATNFERSLDFYTTIGFKVLRDNRDVIWPPLVARSRHHATPGRLSCQWPFRSLTGRLAITSSTSARVSIARQ